MSNKKTCRRFKRTAAGRRCAQFDGGGRSYLRHQQSEAKVCVRFKNTDAGKRCAKYGEKE